MLAAHRGGITTVIIPDENEKDLVEIPKNIKADLNIKCAKWVDEVLEIALERMPEREPKDEKSDKRQSSKSKDDDSSPDSITTH